MSDFVKALPAADLPAGQGMEASVGGRPWPSSTSAAFYAISNTCLHRGGPLGQGYVEGGTVTCPWHAWMFDVSTGENVVNGEMKVACYETKVEDGQILVKVE